MTRRERRHWVLAERPGPWTFPPISASVSAGARLLLAVCDRLVSDLGGVVAYRDTDSALVPSTPEGSNLDLTDGSRLRALSWAEVDEVLHAFDPLSPAPWWPVWKRTREKEGCPLSAVVFGPKRHAAFVDDGAEDPDLTDATQANLGATYADPPAIVGRVGPIDGYRRWSMAAVAREVVYAQARTADPARALRPKAPWDDAGSLPMPALRRYTVKSPEVARRYLTSSELSLAAVTDWERSTSCTVVRCRRQSLSTQAETSHIGKTSGGSTWRAGKRYE